MKADRHLDGTWHVSTDSGMTEWDRVPANDMAYLVDALERSIPYVACGNTFSFKNAKRRFSLKADPDTCWIELYWRGHIVAWPSAESFKGTVYKLKAAMKESRP